jgi:uncharacterized protein (TIRG00374 family)
VDAAVAGPRQPHAPGRARQIVAGALTLAVLVIVFVGIFPKFANYSDAWTAIQQMSLGAVLGLAVATLVNIAVYATPYQAALPGIGFGRAFVVRQTSFMISNAIPAGGAIGLGVQYAMLGGYGIGPAPATAAIGITSVFNLLVTLALPAIGVVLIVVQGEATTNQILGAVVAVVAVAVMVGVLAAVLRSESLARRVGELADRVLHRVRPSMVPEGQDGPATRGVLNFRHSTVDVVSRRLGAITATNVAMQLTQFAVLAVAIYGMSGADAGVNLGEIFAAFALARLASFIPVTPGGLGTVDAAMVALLAAFGMDRDVALAANLVWRACTFIPQVVIGIGTFVWWRRHAGRGRPIAQANAGGGADPTATASASR